MPAFPFLRMLRSTVMKRLLIVYHTQFGGTAQMAEAAFAGARSIDEVDTVLLRAADGRRRRISSRRDALLVATSENFGGMAGMVKDFLERVYYPCEGKLEGRAYAALVCAGTDGTRRDARRRPRGDRAAAAQGASGSHPQERAHGAAGDHSRPTCWPRCREIGATLAAGLAAGIY